MFSAILPDIVVVLRYAEINGMHRYWVLHLSTSKACLEDLVFGLWHGSWFPGQIQLWLARRKKIPEVPEAMHFFVPQCTVILLKLWESTEY